MADLANLPNFQPAPKTYSAAELNALFAAITIATGAVTLAKLQALATNTLIGRATAGTGAAELIPCTAAGRALLAAATAADQRAALEIAAGGGSGLAKVQTAQVIVAASTALQSLPGLSIALAANTAYKITAYLRASVTGTGQCRVQFNTPDTLTATYMNGNVQFIDDNGPVLNNYPLFFNSPAPLATGTAVAVNIAVTGLIRTSAAGTLRVQAAQWNANGSTSYSTGFFEVTPLA